MRDGDAAPSCLTCLKIRLQVLIILPSIKAFAPWTSQQGSVSQLVAVTTDAGANSIKLRCFFFACLASSARRSSCGGRAHLCVTTTPRSSHRRSNGSRLSQCQRQIRRWQQAASRVARGRRHTVPARTRKRRRLPCPGFKVVPWHATNEASAEAGFPQHPPEAMLPLPRPR